jgi:hypothetical protein
MGVPARELAGTRMATTLALTIAFVATNAQP